jgi:hypothetical protein
MRIHLETCARIAEIAGAIAVVVSVIYLAVQINDNTKLLRSQAHYNAINLGQRPLELMVENQDLADVVINCDSDPTGVSPANWLRCGNYYFMQFNAWEYFFYQHGDEAIPKELWNGADAYYRSMVASNAGFGRSWKEIEGTFDEPFRSYVTEEFKKATAAPVN